MPEPDPIETAGPARGNPVRGVDAPPTVPPQDAPDPDTTVIDYSESPGVPVPLGTAVSTSGVPVPTAGQAAAGTSAAQASGGPDVSGAEPGEQAVSGKGGDKGEETAGGWTGPAAHSA